MVTQLINEKRIFTKPRMVCFLMGYEKAKMAFRLKPKSNTAITGGAVFVRQCEACFKQMFEDL